MTQKIAVPSYFYPGTLWTQLQNGAPAVSLSVINPGSGPGNAKDQNYDNTVNATRAKGIPVLGYVHTSYGTRDLSIVLAEVDTYYSWYNLDGIFFDECSNIPSHVDYYNTTYKYVKGMGGNAVVVINPGSLIPSCYASAGDIIMNYEGTYADYMNFKPMGWEYMYPASKFWHLVHGANQTQMQDAMKRSVTNHAGHIYVTPDVMPNPWDTLPDATYWQQELVISAGN
jgi:hypothetical protein